MIDSTNDEIEKIINTRMNNLGIIQNYSKWFACKYKLLYILFIFSNNLEFSRDENQHFSYVLINPPYDMNLKMNDIM
jgi:hypothetical protein